MPGRTKPHLFPSGDVSGRLYQEFREAGLLTQESERLWVEATAKKYNIAARDIRLMIASEEHRYVQLARETVKSEAQIVANRVGLTITKILDVLNDQLGAEKWKALTDKDGRLIRDGCEWCGSSGRTKAEGEDRTRKCQKCNGTGGEIIWLKSPDNPSRLAALKMGMQLYGAFAPERIEIDGHMTLSEVPLTEINARLKAIFTKTINVKPVMREIEGETED